jgi:hypothetical protein
VFEFTETIRIEAPAASVWEYVADVERWWLASNPEHICINVPGPKSAIGPGTEITFVEGVAGIKGEAKGTITQWVPGTVIEWEGEALYHDRGFLLRIREGVSWRVDSLEEETQLCAHVWAVFSSGLTGRIFEWHTRNLLNVVDKDREHARRELVYLKSAIESRHQLSKDAS